MTLEWPSKFRINIFREKVANEQHVCYIRHNRVHTSLLNRFVCFEQVVSLGRAQERERFRSSLIKILTRPRWVWRSSPVHHFPLHRQSQPIDSWGNLEMRGRKFSRIRVLDASASRNRLVSLDRTLSCSKVLPWDANSCLFLWIWNYYWSDLVCLCSFSPFVCRSLSPGSTNRRGISSQNRMSDQIGIPCQDGAVVAQRKVDPGRLTITQSFLPYLSTVTN